MKAKKQVYKLSQQVININHHILGKSTTNHNDCIE